MSTLDYYKKLADPEPRTYRRSGPFVEDERLKTVAEAVAFCERMGFNLSEVALAHNYVMWDHTETEEEVQRRIKSALDGRDKHVEFVRSAYPEYVERGLIDPSGSEVGQR